MTAGTRAGQGSKGHLQMSVMQGQEAGMPELAGWLAKAGRMQGWAVRAGRVEGRVAMTMSAVRAG